MADTIEELFQLTISLAALCTANGVLSAPHGMTPTIGFPSDFAKSISN